jgi:3D (Asp-Asp-Asp) domain-containing protein
VVESVALTQKTIPFSTRTELSADLEIDQQVLLQGGEPGLATARLRTRSEDGVQVSQQSESESVVRPPQDRIIGFGTKIVIRTTTVDGVTFEYWRALNLFATSYQPCDAGINKCYYNTASGKPVQKGVVAMVYPWYLLFVGKPLFIPGYGFATVEDTNGANTSAYGDTYWIDLGYRQTDSVDWVSHHVTVYFLTSVPANPGYILP